MGSEVKRVKCRSLVECVYYRGLIIMQFVYYVVYGRVCLVSLFHCSLLYVLCSLLCPNYFFIFLFVRFMFVFFLYILLSILCVPCFCNVLCIVSLHVYICLFYTVFVYNFTDHCHRVAKKLSLINIVS